MSREAEWTTVSGKRKSKLTVRSTALNLHERLAELEKENKAFTAQSQHLQQQEIQGILVKIGSKQSACNLWRIF